MLAQDDIKKIKRKLQSGYPVGELENDLRLKGYQETEIEEMIYAASVKKMAEGAKKRSAEKISTWNLAGASLLILGISLNTVDTNFKKYSYFILAAGVMSFILKLIFAPMDNPKNK